MTVRFGSSVARLCAPLVMACLSSPLTPASADTSPSWTLAPFALSSGDLSRGPAQAYRAWFENGTYQGDLIEHDLSIDGVQSSDVVPGAFPTDPNSNNWSARSAFAARETADPDYWRATGGRRIVTWDGTGQAAFRWDALTDSQRLALDPLTADPDGDPSTAQPVAAAWDSAVLNYVRGDRSAESTVGVRQRFSLLGDIRHSRPVYVGAPAGSAPVSGYPAFATANRGRAARVYVGANDGLLHAFDAENGEEVWAYAPSVLFGNLASLAVRPYQHTAFVDGEPVAGDAVVGSRWRSVLVGGFGDGARGLYVLDITTPSLGDETATSGDDVKVLWELSGDGGHVGHVRGRPSIARLADGHDYAIVGNGSGSLLGRAELVLMDLTDGSWSTIDTGVDGSNGLSAAAVVDRDGDAVLDTAYAGDLAGNLWQFDLPARTARRLFAAGDEVAFTSAPDVSRHPLGGLMVLAASGRLLDADDVADESPQAVYAIRDKPGAAGAVTPATLATVSAERIDGLRFADRVSVDWGTQDGWAFALSETGERVLGAPSLRDRRLQFTSVTPSGEAWFLQLDWIGGGASDRVVFDLNGDGALDDGDRVTRFGLADAPIGRLLGTGRFSQPTFARVSGGRDSVWINGLRLPTIASCSGACDGGLQGGHVDVDTDTVLGDATDAHVHEYDDSYGVTFMDFFDLQPPSGGSLGHADAVGIPGTQPLVAVLANADLSPGGRLSIGEKTWNVVDYQEMVQRALTEWDGVSPLLDDDGDSLTFTLDELANTAGGLRIAFDDRAIVNGGLLPTVTGCVKGELRITNGRWRNGALTLQLLDTSALLPGDAPINVWIAQTPTDLATGLVGGGLHGNLAAPAAFRYESTLFWHHKGSCYGDDGYEASVLASRAEIIEAQVADLFPDFAGNSVDILTLLEALENFSCIEGVGAVCAAYQGYRDIEAELNLLLGDYRALRDFLNGAEETFSTGVAAVVEELTEEFNPALGPNYALGRRTWIDLSR